MIFLSYIKTNVTEFITKLRSLCATLKINIIWLLAVMWLESRLNPKAVNSNGGATGLIQFMPSTAIALGTTTTALYNMSNVQQLVYVYKYLKPYAPKIKNFYDLYLAIFFPLAMGKPDSWIIHSDNLTAERVANANPGFDLDKNKQITIAEFKAAVNKLLPAEALKAIVEPGIKIIPLVVSGLIIGYIYNKIRA